MARGSLQILDAVSIRLFVEGGELVAGVAVDIAEAAESYEELPESWQDHVCADIGDEVVAVRRDNEAGCVTVAELLQVLRRDAAGFAQDGDVLFLGKGVEPVTWWG